MSKKSHGHSEYRHGLTLQLGHRGPPHPGRQVECPGPVVPVGHALRFARIVKVVRGVAALPAHHLHDDVADQVVDVPPRFRKGVVHRLHRPESSPVAVEVRGPPVHVGDPDDDPVAHSEHLPDALRVVPIIVQDVADRRLREIGVRFDGRHRPEVVPCDPSRVGVSVVVSVSSLTRLPSHLPFPGEEPRDGCPKNGGTTLAPKTKKNRKAQARCARSSLEARGDDRKWNGVAFICICTFVLFANKLYTSCCTPVTSNCVSVCLCVSVSL